MANKDIQQRVLDQRDGDEMESGWRNDQVKQDIQTATDIAAIVVDSIADADTTHAPSRNAVFDALALKGLATCVGTATGTNTLTSTLAPVPVLVDFLTISLRAAGANTTAVTLDANGTGAIAVTKLGGFALIATDIYGAGHELILRYRSSVPRWELLNPGPQPASPVGSALTSAYMWVGNGANVAAAVLMSGDVTISNAGVTTLATAQPAVHTWALAQTFTVAPVFTDASGTRAALGLAIGTNVQAYDADLTTWAGITPGTGVGAALAINVGSAGAFVTFNGAGGTPSSLALANATGLPVAGGGTGVASLTAYAPIFGGSTSTNPVQSGTVGTAGQVLTSNGAGALPTFQAAAAAGQASIQFEYEGANLGTSGTATEVDFTGSALVASRAADKITVNVAATGGGGATSDIGLVLQLPNLPVFL